MGKWTKCIFLACAASSVSVIVYFQAKSWKWDTLELLVGFPFLRIHMYNIMRLRLFCISSFDSILYISWMDHFWDSYTRCAAQVLEVFYQWPRGPLTQKWSIRQQNPMGLSTRSDSWRNARIARRVFCSAWLSCRACKMLCGVCVVQMCCAYWVILLRDVTQHTWWVSSVWWHQFLVTKSDAK